MIVVGGAHREFCLRPSREAFYGPGITGTIVAQILGHPATLTTVAHENDRTDVAFMVRTYGADADVRPAAQTMAFVYATPLSVPEIVPRPDGIDQLAFNIDTRSEHLLMYGMLDARPRLGASTVVYDPQSVWRPLRFRTDLDGRAERLAYVLNAQELRKLQPGADLADAAARLLRDERADVVIVKLGVGGALVVEESGRSAVPAYSAGASSHLIGSGDVFTASFACDWTNGKPAAESADLASRRVANYVVDGLLDALADPLPTKAVTPWRGSVYLAAPFFTLAERWLVEEVRRYIDGLGMRARSPLHEVGIGEARDVSLADLRLLDACERVVALCDGRDPGTIFEVGYAQRAGKRVWAVSTSTRDPEIDAGDLRMLFGSGVTVFDDLVAALMDLAAAS